MDNSGAENHTTIFTIAESPLDENVIWVGTDDGNVQVTKDGGKNWQNVVSNIEGLPSNTWTYHIEASVHGKGIAYAVFDGHNSGDMQPYVYKTSDFGTTWTNIITDNVIGTSRNIQEDYKNENLLFLGTEFGLYITADGGKNWEKFTKNVPPVAVHFIDLQKQTNDLVLGTHGRGIIIIEDISPLREITTEVLKSKLHFFSSKTMKLSDESGFAGSFGAETQFVGENANRSPQIKYLLPKRHTFGKMSMEIKNSKGEVVSKLSPGKSKGINIVNWSGNIKQPKVAKGKTLAFGGFATPRVEAGSYKAVITKGRDVYEHTFEIVYDERSGLTSADRKMKHDIMSKMYKMTEELAYMVYQIDAFIEAPETKSKLKSKLNELKKTLVITTGDNYVGSAEPELREKLADLFSKIVGSYDKPSNSELDFLSIVENRFSKAKEDFDKMSKKVKSKKDMGLKTFEEFTK